MPDTIYIPVTWELDAIPDACAKLVTLTGHDFEAEMLEAAGSGEVPADGWYGIQTDPDGNLENARHLGAEAAVRWDAVAEWLRAKGHDVRRGHWIEFDEALTQLQARIRPAPTAAELECWIGFSSGLTAYVDCRVSQWYSFENYSDWSNTDLPKRRLHLWLDSEEVAAFQPPHRCLTMPQLCERWLVDESKARARLQSMPEVNSWPLLCDETSSPFELVIELACIEAIENQCPAWLKFDAFAQSADRQIFPHLDLRKRDQFDYARHKELLSTDPSRIHARNRAADALDMSCLSCWLEPDRIAGLYGDQVLAETVSQVVGIALRARSVCHGFAIYVDDWLHWPGRPQMPAGEAGERVRAWLSMASVMPTEGTSDQPHPPLTGFRAGYFLTRSRLHVRKPVSRHAPAWPFWPQPADCGRTQAISRFLA